MQEASLYEIHPSKEWVVLTPDGGVIECKHVAAAKRVRDELNRVRGLLSEAPRFFSHHEFEGEKLAWLQRANIV